MRLSCLDNVNTLACTLQSRCLSCYSRTSTHWERKNSLLIAFRSAMGKDDIMCACVGATQLCIHINAAQISTDCNVLSTQACEVIFGQHGSGPLSCSLSRARSISCLGKRDLTFNQKRFTVSAKHDAQGSFHLAVSHLAGDIANKLFHHLIFKRNLLVYSD